jgi:DNA-binding NtrC family response regulator
MASFLIVDEDRNFREALAIALRLDGHDASVSAAAEDARARLADARFTCCVVDAHLAGAEGLLGAALESGARVIATGPYPELLEAAAGRHPGAETLTKPFRALDLARLVVDRARAAG